MSEQIYTKVSLGRQSVVGTAVAGSTIFPVETGFLGFDLDRASESPDEDIGVADRELAGRESTGIRQASATLPFVASFQNFMHPLEMHVAGSVAPTGAGPYVYTYTYDSTADTLKPYTIEYGDENSTQDEWRAIGAVANQFDFGFDDLAAPGNAMWTGSLGLLAMDRKANAMTGSLAVPATLETMEGHTTTLAEGSTATAFASLAELTTSLASFRMSSALNAVGRPYGSTGDTATAWGRSGHGNIDFEAKVKIGATSKTDILDVFDVSGPLPTEKRWRITIDGTGNNVMTIDARVRYRAVNLGDRDGERLYGINGVFVRDSTLGGRAQFKLTNDVSAIP